MRKYLIKSRNDPLLVTKDIFYTFGRLPVPGTSTGTLYGTGSYWYHRYGESWKVL